MIENVIFWGYVSLTVVGLLSSIAKQGKPRDPLTATDTIIGLLVSGIIVWGMWYLWSR